MKSQQKIQARHSELLARLQKVRDDLHEVEQRLKAATKRPEVTHLKKRAQSLDTEWFRLYEQSAELEWVLKD